MNYRVVTNDGREELCGTWQKAEQAAREFFGAVAFYHCDDGRVFFYSSQEDCDAGLNGVEIGAIEETGGAE